MIVIQQCCFPVICSDLSLTFIPVTSQQNESENMWTEILTQNKVFTICLFYAGDLPSWFVKKSCAVANDRQQL